MKVLKGIIEDSDNIVIDGVSYNLAPPTRRNCNYISRHFFIGNETYEVIKVTNNEVEAEQRYYCDYIS